MPQSRRVTPYLQRRLDVWYFRFQLPSRLRPFASRTEICVSLHTAEVSIARERATPALAHVYSLKRLCKLVMELTADEVRRIVHAATLRLVDAIERSREPVVLDDSEASPGMNEYLLAKEAFGFKPALVPDQMYGFVMADTGRALHVGDHTRGAALARHVLAAEGGEAVDDSELFQQLSLQMLRLHHSLRAVAIHRSRGDRMGEYQIVEHYRRSGLAPLANKPVAQQSAVSISQAWKEYAAEKTGSQPKPDWSNRTATFQEATFAEFRELVGDIAVAQLNRDTMLRYRNSIGRLPANRHKRYPGKPVAELLAMEIPADQLPSARTVHERLVRVGAFLKWCRDTKGYLAVDPMAGIHVRADSQSYAPFTKTDLEALFYSDDYKKGEHAKSWQYWIPLIALYTGARQTEIAQLRTKDITQEDGIWVFAITNEGEGQKVKSKAGIRKVPISCKLRALGLLDYVKALNERGASRLFPDLTKGVHGWGDKVSRWFGDTYRERCGIKKTDATGGRKVFHSFRHTAITMALGKAQPLAHCQQVFGHEKSLLGETATYMAPFPVQTLVPIIESLDYGLDHSAYAGAWRKMVGTAP